MRTVCSRTGNRTRVRYVLVRDRDVVPDVNYSCIATYVQESQVSMPDPRQTPLTAEKRNTVITPLAAIRPDQLAALQAAVARARLLPGAALVLASTEQRRYQKQR